MSNHKAPTFDEVAARLDKMFATNFVVPSVRELKDACGGQGSLSTYQAYLKRWVGDRQSASGMTAILLAIRAEKSAHDSVMSLLLTRLEQHMRIFPAGFDLIGDDDDDDEMEDSKGIGEIGPQSPLGSCSRSRDAADDGVGVAAKTDTSAAFADIASRSEARFIDDNDVIVPGARLDQRPVTNGPAQQDRSAHKPTDQHSRHGESMSLSRSDGGGQQAALPLGTNQPAPGESDTDGGSRHGNA